MLCDVPHGFPLSHKRLNGSPYSENTRSNTGFTAKNVSFSSASVQRQKRQLSSRMFSGWQRMPLARVKFPLKSVCHMTLGCSFSKRWIWVAARLAALLMRWLRAKMLLNVRTQGRFSYPMFSMILWSFSAPSAGYCLRS